MSAVASQVESISVLRLRMTNVLQDLTALHMLGKVDLQCLCKLPDSFQMCEPRFSQRQLA